MKVLTISFLVFLMLKIIDETKKNQPLPSAITTA
jgi:hypothetical protein